MIDKIKEKINTFISPEEENTENKKAVILDPGHEVSEPDMRVIGLFADVSEDKVAELVHALLYLNELNKTEYELNKAEKEKNKRPKEFWERILKPTTYL